MVEEERSKAVWWKRRGVRLCGGRKGEKRSKAVWWKRRGVRLRGGRRREE